ncbi:PSD1 and planctomycete cytochrome C domain-containing protein [uncultured Gimesia sp.]|uniref:PSD1 and planctomycete cytochrome C domain-containing protein n=1 Tax=uncultured Gimesia sp. TaxID=1678688 RepID=UPI0030D7FEE7|tara:strand:- start:61836 stop:64229 length:2394 start_codon:yes stop_codon:yes gene_type:complete
MYRIMLRHLWIGLIVCFIFPIQASFAQNKVSFNRDIRPILSRNCFHCHGPDSTHREADLRLDIETGLKSTMEDSSTIHPGKPDQSQLFERITSTDADLVMPPADSGKSLKPSEIQLIKQWITDGAPWAKHWAYQRPQTTPIPEVEDQNWPVNWIDRFILSRLEEQNLQPAEEADKVTLIRRLSFDLTGLPPTPQEVDQFVNDQSSDAYEKLVDRLLASPHYGERMAIYWLDLVRFADTVGYHGDQDHSISPYRDYVIRAFNENIPFDQFTREQLAGDLLPHPTLQQKIATGYNRVLQTSHEGGVQPKEYLAIYAADRIRNFSGVWMGATMGCCQCHDHKYDPYTIKDFYSLVSFFADIDEAKHFTRGSNRLPTIREPEIFIYTAQEKQQISEIEANIKTTQLALKATKQKQEQKQLEQKLDQLKKNRAAIDKSARKTMITVSIKPREIRVLPRGNWLDETGPVVQPAIPNFLGTLKTSNSRLTRLDLANWLSDEDGYGLMLARVMANRFWYLFFGRGIAPVLDDFGGQGGPPHSPELLDQLALNFYKEQWDVKQTVKFMVMSRAYRQSSLETTEQRKQDPFNQLLNRQARFRLPAEMIRDNALAVSGLLVTDIGGPSVKPYQPAGYYRHLNFPTRKYVAHTDERQWRRGLYVHWQRQFLHPMLKAFDAPSREECTAQRPRSNTPIAAMTLLNDPTFVEASRKFAENVLQNGGDSDAEKIRYAFSKATSRTPENRETEVLMNLLNTNRSEYRSKPKAAVELTKSGLAKTNPELNARELASWTEITRALLNLNEVVTRN